MKRLAALAALTLAIGSTALPAFARDAYVIDNAHMLSTAAAQQLNQKIGDFHNTTGKEVVVDIEPSLDGATLESAIERTFAQKQVNGVLIYVAKAEKKIAVYGDRASTRFFPSGTFTTITKAMRASFNSGSFDEGINTGVDLVLDQYRSHEGALGRVRQRNVVPANTLGSDTSGGFHMSWIVWLIVLAVIFFVIRGIFRAIAGPRMMPPGYGPGMGPGMGPMGGGYGPGYGPGYGGGGGGGSFWSGMLGGLGGAFLGNELFGRRDNFGGDGGGTYSDMGGGGNSQDASGWQNDAGQVDMSNGGSSSWGGDSGGGWGGDSGGGDGGGGDGGGGW